MPGCDLSLTDFEGLPCHIVNLVHAVTDLIMPEGLQGGTDDRFADAFFGRDALRVALDVGPWLPMLARHTLISCARLQGRTENPLSEEQPGRIHHEYRSLYIGGTKVGVAQMELLRHLVRLWGGSGNEVIYFGAADTTPQFLRLLDATVGHQGAGILEEEVPHRSGATVTVRATAAVAAEWIASGIARSDLGLLEFLRRNPNGHRFQVMRDGVTSYLHESGELVNSDFPIASLEVQALAFDALLGAARLLRDSQPDDAARWEATARSLRDSTFHWFWRPVEECFCMAIDRDPAGTPRPVQTLSSNASELLDTQIFDDLDPAERVKYVSSIVRMMYGPDFLTDAGVRNLALRHHALLPYFDYQGSLVTWPTISNVFAQGLRRHGLKLLAVDQENRYLNALNLTNNLVEFLYVDADGHVDYDPYCQQSSNGVRTPIPAIDIPARSQGWTISAALRALLERTQAASRRHRQVRTETPDLEAAVSDLLNEPTAPIRTRDGIEAARRGGRRFRIDSNAGRALRRAHWTKLGVRLYAHDDPADGFYRSD